MGSGSPRPAGSAPGAAGAVRAVVLTSGVSPVTATLDEILRTDLLGCGYVIEDFLPVVFPGGAAVCIASMAASLVSLPPETERPLASAPIPELLDPPGLDLRALAAGHAYAIAKRANQLRVQGASAEWGDRGARINTVSPGLVATTMGSQELAGPSGERLRRRVEGSPLPRPGTPDEIACAVEFLLGPGASYLTGTNLIVDGGCATAVVRGDGGTATRG